MSGATPSSPFDDSLYASKPYEMLVRSLQLGLRYYFWDVPRYWRHQRTTATAGSDLGVLRNPLREFGRRSYHTLPLPPGYTDELNRCFEAGVRFDLPEVRLAAVAAVLWAVRDVEGDIIECGAYRGATALFMSTLLKVNKIDKRVFALDTFGSTPSGTSLDPPRPSGAFDLPSSHLELLKHQAHTLGVGATLITCPGLFKDTFAGWHGVEHRYSMAHIDANLYESTREACEHCIPRMTARGAIVFDDYNGVCDLGARHAIREAAQHFGLNIASLAHCSAWTRVGAMP